ncbi:MAG: OmpA family protein [Actinoplanes sp.]
MTAVGALLAAIVIAPVIGARPAAAAVPTSAGTHFWLAFPPSASDSPTLQLHITSDYATSGTVDFGATPADFQVLAGSVTTVPIPSSLVVTESDDSGYNGIEVSALDPVSVYALSTDEGVSGGFLALPTSALGIDYRVLAAPAGQVSQLTVVATVDNTTVTITPTMDIAGHSAGYYFMLNLNAGETYQLRAPGPADIITGTTVTATEPVVVYGGNACGNVPDTYTKGCDYLVQQMTPTDTWGRQFLAMPFADRSLGDYYRILAHQDQTEVYINGGIGPVLNAGDVYSQVITESTVDIETSKPALVAQFATGAGYDELSRGDPLMMLIPPVDRYLSRYTVPAPSIAGFNAYATVIVPASALGQVTLDDNLIPYQLFSQIGYTNHYGVTFPIDPTVHRFAGPTGFGLQIYEWGVADAFGFAGGMTTFPAPTAEPLDAFGSGPWYGQTIVPIDGYVTLADGGVATNTVTVLGQGTYTLDPISAIIEFTPLAGYVGSPTPVIYQVGDKYDQTASNTFSPVVDDRAPGTPGTPASAPGDGKATVTIAAASVGGTVATYTVRVVGDANKFCTVTVPAASCEVSGLTNGTAYTFESRATNTTNSSDWSNASNSVTPTLTAPGVPGTPSAVAGNARATVTVAAPTTGGPVATYTVRVVGNDTKTCTVTVPAISCPVNGLSNGTAYTFETRATNSGGSSAWSGPSASVVPFTVPVVVPDVPVVPSAPTGVTATAGTASLTATWNATPNATGYTVTALPGPATCTTSGTSCVLGATSGTTYTVTVTANGPGGSSPASSASNAVTPSTPDVPAVPPSAAPATLTTDKGQIGLAVPGQQITVVGTGFAPRSTTTIILYSAPVTLGTAVTDEAGAFSLSVTIPAGLENGTHTFLASGVNPAGAVRQMALPVTIAPTSTGSTGEGGGTQNTTIPLPTNGFITLLDAEGMPVTTVTVAQGTYALDAVTGAITFVAVAGFVGKAAPVAYRISDAVGSVVTGSYTATVTSGGGDDPGPSPSTGSAKVVVTKLVVTRGRPARATLPVIVAFDAVTKAHNTAVLWSTVSGRRVTLGTGRATMTVASRRAAVTIVLNPLGRALAATPGGYPIAVAMTTVPTTGGRTLRASSRTRLVLNQFTVPRAVFFASGSATVTPAQRRYLATLRTKLAGVRTATCVGHTDDRGNRAAGLRLGRTRAQQVCHTLTTRLTIRTSIETRGEANPTGSNKTPAGMARNRRVDITIRY